MWVTLKGHDLFSLECRETDSDWYTILNLILLFYYFFNSNYLTFQRILIQFKALDIEYESVSCRWDGLTVHDGKTTKHPRLMLHCGQDLPLTFISSGRWSLWVFTSDKSISQKGFLFQFKAIKKR